MERLTEAQVKDGLKDRNSLVHFIGTVLGYRTELVLYESPAEELGIPPYLTTKIKSWCLLSSYPGHIPFQIHLVEVKELTFYTCRDISDSLLRRHPANYLFVFTDDYSCIVFFAVERSLERRPYMWRPAPKHYYRFVPIDSRNATQNDLVVLSSLRLDDPTTDPPAIYDKIVAALKLSMAIIPQWFMPWYYRMGFSKETYHKLQESGMI